MLQRSNELNKTLEREKIMLQELYIESSIMFMSLFIQIYCNDMCVKFMFPWKFVEIDKN